MATAPAMQTASREVFIDTSDDADTEVCAQIEAVCREIEDEVERISDASEALAH